MIFALISSLVLSTVADSAQVFSRPLSEAEILCIEAEDQRADCEFSKALETYRQAAAATTDSLLLSRVDSLQTICRNGSAMAQFCLRPKVAGRQLFAASEFLDYYPFTIEQRESLMTSPVDTLMLADSTRIAAFFPLENEGFVYFSSRELYGLGGADLYRCRRIPGSPFVGEPENLGFPYSSPADDYLLLNTPDGDYTIFASNRGCGADSVYLYALVREAVPVRSAVAEGEPLRSLCELSPASSQKVSPSQKKALEAYEKASSAFTHEQDTLSRSMKEVEAMRRRYSEVSGVEKQFLGDEISRMEMALPALRKKEAAAKAKLLAAEAECRRQGIQPEPSVPSWTFSRCQR